MPLEAEASVTLAYRLEGVGDLGFRKSPVSEEATSECWCGVGGRIVLPRAVSSRAHPVVFVHGTASSPAGGGDGQRAAQRFTHRQPLPILVLHYNSGNPVARPPCICGRGCRPARKEIDPAGADPALQDMVVMGHSQGGLLTKMTVVHSGTRFWDNVSRVPSSRRTFHRDERSACAAGCSSTPCRSSNGSSSSPRLTAAASSRRASSGRSPPAGQPAGDDHEARCGAGDAEPGRDGADGLASADGDRQHGLVEPVLRTLGVTAHRRGRPRALDHCGQGQRTAGEGNDGVVQYTSAPHRRVESELVVRSSHSTQAEPATIEEVRRILYEHAGIH